MATLVSSNGALVPVQQSAVFRETKTAQAALGEAGPVQPSLRPLTIGNSRLKISFTFLNPFVVNISESLFARQSLFEASGNWTSPP